MTATVLQFNQHIRQTNHQSASNSHSDYIDTPMTKEYHQIMIDLLNTEHPFRAVRIAEEINRVNGFELISVGVIREWKKGLSRNQNSFSVNQNENSQIKFEKTKSENNQDLKIRNQNLEIKLQQLAEGYIKLLAAQNRDIDTIVT